MRASDWALIAFALVIAAAAFAQPMLREKPPAPPDGVTLVLVDNFDALGAKVWCLQHETVEEKRVCLDAYGVPDFEFAEERGDCSSRLRCVRLDIERLKSRKE